MKTPKNILLVTLDGGGNIPPVLATAKGLAAAGHHVTVLSEPCMEQPVKSSGLQFIPFTQHYTRNNRNEDLIRDANTNIFNNPFFDDVVFGPSPILVEQCLSAIDETRADLLLVDCLLPAAVIAAKAKKIPAAVLFHMPEYPPGKNRPPGVMGILPGTNAITRLRDKLLAVLFHKKLNQYLPMLNGLCKQYQLPPLKNTADLLHRCDLRIIQTLPEFDFPLVPAPANVRYSGPVLDDPDWVSEYQNPWPANNQQPLIVISLSSTYQAQEKTIQQCINALAALPVRGLVTLGPALAHHTFQLPPNVIALPSAPYSKVFPMAGLVITHGGHGTIMRALSHGLPLLCLPMGRDQNDNAIKVTHHQLGQHLSPKASAKEIETAIQKLLNNTVYSNNAKKFSQIMAANSGAKNAVREIETLL